MFLRTVRLARKLVSGLLASDSPRQLAAGFTLGMVVGLLPKGNLIAVSLCVLLFSLRVNKGLALAAAVTFSCLSPLADTFYHKLGAIVLSAPSLQTTYASVFTLPLGPWLDFDNTVVTGSLLVGLYLAYPVYWAVRSLSARLQLRANATSSGVTP